MANYMTFEDLQNEVARAISDTGVAKRDLIKHVINQVYLNEILQCDDLYPLHWLHAYWRQNHHAPNTITGITQANPGVITCTGHGYIGNELIAFWDIGGMVELNYDERTRVPFNAYYIVKYINANTFSLLDQDGTTVDTTTFTAYTSGGTINHHGWKVSSLAELIGVGIYDDMPLTAIDWKTFMADPGGYFDETPQVPDTFLHLQFFDGAGAESNHVLTFPGSSLDQEAYLEYTGRCDRLDANSDVPKLPHDFHPAIVAGACTRLAENNVQVENAVIWPGLYSAHLEAIRAYNRRWWERHERKLESKPYGLL